VHEAEVYIVRVYRREAGGVSGMVENVRERTATSFRSTKDLVDVIVQSSSDDTGKETEEGKP
jgi:hypothetical protein